MNGADLCKQMSNTEQNIHHRLQIQFNLAQMTASCCAIVYLQQLMPLLTPPHQPQLLHRPRLDPEAGFILHHLKTG